jgi:hypothetical protein
LVRDDVTTVLNPNSGSQPPTGTTDGQLIGGVSTPGQPWTIGTDGSKVFSIVIRQISPSHNDRTTPDPPLDDEKTRQTIAHEIGHNLYLFDRFQDCPATTVMVSDYFSQTQLFTCPWNNIPTVFDFNDYSHIRVR